MGNVSEVGKTESKSIQMRLTVSTKLYEQLSWLKTNTSLGVSENDVAVYILARQLRGSHFDELLDSDSPLPKRQQLPKRDVDDG